MGKIKDITGNKYNYLTVLGLDHIDRNHKSHWKCQCDCGKIVVLQKDNFVFGNTKSCGCYKKKNTAIIKTKHGKRKTRLYNIYRGMKARCFNKNDHKYPIYGQRGITICEQWLGEDGFINFYNWAINNGYSDNLSIDRIDVNGNYEPSNCRWATAKEQALNTRFNTKYDGFGYKLSAAEWSKVLGICKSTFYRRLKRGINVEEMFTESKDAGQRIVKILTGKESTDE